MQPSPFSTWLPPAGSNSFENSSLLWSNSTLRKRKAAATDLEDNDNQKMFVTEEKILKDMRTLSLDLTANPPVIDTDVILDDVQPVELDDEENESSPETTERSRFEYHPLLKDSLKKDDFQDHFLNKLCEIERKKLSMQIVPFIPIHPAQLSQDPSATIQIEKPKETEEVEEKPVQIDDHLFKRPFIPTAYTVEEPTDGVVKRAPTMKRSFSQCNQYNSNLSVTELKHDTKDDSVIRHSSSAYFIVEPASSPPTISTMSNELNSSPLSTGLSARIIDCTDDPLSTVDNDDDVDMQSVASSDTGDKMDDD